MRRKKGTKYIFVTGGVVSSLGKGLAAASIARILEETGAELQPQFFVLEDLATIAQRLEPQLTANDADALARPAALRGRLGRIARSLFGSRSGTA